MFVIIKPIVQCCRFGGFFVCLGLVVCCWFFFSFLEFILRKKNHTNRNFKQKSLNELWYDLPSCSVSNLKDPLKGFSETAVQHNLNLLYMILDMENNPYLEAYKDFILVGVLFFSFYLESLYLEIFCTRTIPTE